MCPASWTHPMLWRAPPWEVSERCCGPSREDKSRCTPGDHTSMATPHPCTPFWPVWGRPHPFFVSSQDSSTHTTQNLLTFSSPTQRLLPQNTLPPHFTSTRPSADTLDSVLALFCSGSLGQWRPPGWLRGGKGVSDLGNGPTEGAAGMPSWTMAQGPRWSWRD